MSQLARVEADRRHDVVLVRIVGEIDISNAGELPVAIGSEIPNDATVVLLDLSRTTYLDSAGVQLLYRLAHRLETRRQQLRLIVPAGAPIRTVLELTGLLELVPLVDQPEGRATS